MALLLRSVLVAVLSGVAALVTAWLHIVLVSKQNHDWHPLALLGPPIALAVVAGIWVLMRNRPSIAMGIAFVAETIVFAYFAILVGAGIVICRTGECF